MYPLHHYKEKDLHTVLLPNSQSSNTAKKKSAKYSTGLCRVKTLTFLALNNIVGAFSYNLGYIVCSLCCSCIVFSYCNYCPNIIKKLVKILGSSDRIIWKEHINDICEG